MIQQKAPKDMTATEFVAEVRKRIEDKRFQFPLNWNDLYGMLNEPAPNPFTPDQIAWMREEQRNGFNYAAFCMEDLCVFEQCPEKVHGIFVKNHVQNRYAYRSSCFLSGLLSSDDAEPLCFSDYAPLEGESA